MKGDARMTNRDVELSIVAIRGLVLVGGLITVIFYVAIHVVNWQHRHAKRLVGVCALFGAILLGGEGVSYWNYKDRTQRFAEMVGAVPSKIRSWTIEPDEYKPGILWWRGAFAPAGFEHGTAWCMTLETEGYEIRTLALDDPKIVYVDVYDDGHLDAVYNAEVKKGYYPFIPKPSKPRPPNASEREHYASVR